MPELSDEQARKNLEAVLCLKGIGVILGEHAGQFLSTYRALYAQLRQGDRLDIELDATDGDRHNDNVFFRTVLYTSDGRKRYISSGSRNGSVSPVGSLLYGD